MRALHLLLLLWVLAWATVGVARADGGYADTVRLTHYVVGGITYGGGHTYLGSAACSWDLPLGTRITLLATGETFTCDDRGLLGSGWPASWVDIYGLNRDYLGRYADVWVEVP